MANGIATFCTNDWNMLTPCKIGDENLDSTDTITFPCKSRIEVYSARFPERNWDTGTANKKGVARFTLGTDSSDLEF